MASNVHQQFSYRGSFAEQPTPSKPEVSAGAGITLLVHHLPESIPHDMLARLFSYYGASSFRQCPGGSLRNCAFVEFKDETSASLAQSQLNRLKFHKKVLSVERVRNAALDDKGQQGQVHPANESSCKPALQLEDNPVSGNTKGSLSSLPSSSEPIAPKLGVDYPFPPFLEYNYPPPDGNILTNIVNTLIAVPRFYTQVLHLMNKMNIPAPFRIALPMPPLPPPVPAPPPPPPPNTEEPPSPDISSEESEMESSDEEVDGVQRKRRKMEAIVGPAVDKGVAHEDVGLRPASLVPKEVPLIKKKNPIMQIKIAPKTSQTEIKTGDGIPTQVTETSKDVEAKSFATPQEIESGKLPLEEILSLPKFKAYAAGSPNSVLYIKNLAKDVVMDDFYFIFGSFFASSEAARTGLNIKLMQEGRMRDQAFVTFPSVDLAHRALELVNGYVFKGKPMVIQFGRKPDNKTS